MSDQRLTNLLGAFSLGLVDCFVPAAETVSAHGGAAPAALVTIGMETGLSIRLLREILGLSHPGTVRLIDRLEQDGLVVRREGGADGRMVALHLTASGAALRHQILAARFSELNPIVAQLSDTDKRALTEILEKMLRHLTTSLNRSYQLCRLCDEHLCPQPICPVETTAQALEERAP